MGSEMCIRDSFNPAFTACCCALNRLGLRKSSIANTVEDTKFKACSLKYPKLLKSTFLPLTISLTILKAASVPTCATKLAIRLPSSIPFLPVILTKFSGNIPTTVPATLIPESINASFNVLFPFKYSAKFLPPAVVAEVNGVKSMAYWINDIMFFGVVVGSYIISPLPLLFARIRLLFYEEIGEDYMCTVNYELVRSVNGLYIYRITGDGWNSSVLHNIDDKAVMVVATSTFIDTIICIYFTYPAPIYSYRGLSSHVKLRYGARALPLEFSVVGELMYIGDMLYEVKLYMWRTVK